MGGRICLEGCDCKRHDPEVRQRIADANRNREHAPWTEEQRAKKRDSNTGWVKGSKHSKESRAKMSEARKGRKQTPEHAEKRAAAIRGKKREPTLDLQCTDCGEPFKAALRSAIRCPQCRKFGRKRLNSFAYRHFKKECAICGRKDLLHGDHCHTTDTPRGILCVNCNLGIGNFKDDVELMKKAISYLEESRNV